MFTDVEPIICYNCDEVVEEIDAWTVSTSLDTLSYCSLSCLLEDLGN